MCVCVFKLTLALGSGGEAGAPLPRFDPPSLGFCLSVFLSFRASFFNFARRTLDMAPVGYLQLRATLFMESTEFKSNQLISSIRVYSIKKKKDSLNRHDSQLSSDGVYSVPLLATRRLSLLLLKDQRTDTFEECAECNRNG